jgi:hypothetical protein
MITRRKALLSATAAPLLFADQAAAEAGSFEQIQHHAAELRRLLNVTRPNGTAPVTLILFDDRYGGFVATTGSVESGGFMLSSDQPEWALMADRDGPHTVG